MAVIGKPNVGKSSLINYLAGEERVIVSDIAGTTRDATDTVIENEYGKYIFIDTAGIRRKAKVEDAIERYSVLRSYMAVDRCDVGDHSYRCGGGLFRAGQQDSGLRP